jgi:hypothetical protein
MNKAVKLMKLTEKQVELITRTAIEVYEKQKEKDDKVKYDRRLRNIKLLLKNYRSFVKHSGDIKLEIEILNEKLELDYLDTNELAIESIKRSKARTLTIVKFINRMLSVYKAMCEEEGIEAKRKYEVIKALYIDNPQTSIKTIADVHFVSEKTIRRDRDKACEDLTVLMFGVDSIRLK